jgi:hypothetical protein
VDRAIIPSVGSRDPIVPDPRQGASAGIARVPLCPPKLYQAWLRDGAIGAELPWAEISKEIYDGTVVILKNVYDAAKMLAFREGVVRWGRSVPVFPHGESPSVYPVLNYHRIDDGVIRSACPHIFHQYGFKAIDQLDADLRNTAREIAETVKDLQNRLAGTNFAVSPDGLYLKVLHYPAGGGFLAEHTHPLRPQGVGLITSLSRLGADLSDGAVTIASPAGLVDASRYHDIGDIVCFRYDLPHAVTPVDPTRYLDWNSESGKWSVVLELRHTHASSHNKQQG